MPRAARPATIAYGLSAGSETQLPAVRGPSTLTALPEVSRICPEPWMTGSAAATPGTARTRGRIAASMGRRAYEIVIVDDSSQDGTVAVCDELRKRFPLRLVTRPPQNGLSGAVLEGMREAAGW